MKNGETLAQQKIMEFMENGEICAICQKPLEEEYGRAIACEECGGEAVLSEDAHND
jgi:hypothetical protein